MMPIRKFFTLPIIAVLKKFDLYSSFMLRTASPLKDDGWFRSYRERASVDAAGKPIPWITYPAIEFLKKRVNREMTVFEYGCGGSTLWWASRVAQIHSVEHDRGWYLKVSANLPANVQLTHIELEYGGAYSQEVGKYHSAFDIVVVDGRDRVNCARNAVQALKPGGVILWDNCDREEYREGYRFLFDNGFRKIEFVGLSPAVECRNETGIFYRPGNCLGI